MNDDIYYKVLKIIEQNPTVSQRELAKQLGVSLGKTNYCLKALLQKGLVKAKNFKNSQNKVAYAYLLTPRGVEQKSVMTVNFLKRKRAEYKALRQEIKQLSQEVSLTKV